ncbi:hypothetical protein CLOSTMETH_01457 [[Clostridium] methylpentosum DSM 5476]|uniref:Uncharacterized protein n=1 Tax=[Clostridium] methylpentosum DSM 5476 TaxID=537013 RepID=C0EC88_9FIRM|nr:hypothetical protein CLOSTMETH_01457 [[Clostridium] methylpentosum DSM 5476]
MTSCPLESVPPFLSQKYLPTMIEPQKHGFCDSFFCYFRKMKFFLPNEQDGNTSFVRNA